jgi:hypothetical protein
MENQTAVAIRSPLADREFNNTKEAEEQYAVLYRQMEEKVPATLERTYKQVSQSEKTKFMIKAGIVGGGALFLGYIVLQLIGFLIAAAATVAVGGGLFWWWKFKLPGQILRAQNASKQELQRLYHERLETYKAEEIRHLEKLKAQATENPIETLELELQAMQSERKALSEANTTFRGHAQSLAEELAESRRDNPGVDFSEQETQLEELKLACSADDNELTNFIQAISQMEAVVKEARSKWNFAVKMDKALAARDAARGNEAQRKILAATALDSVRQKHSELFARIHTRAVELAAAKTVQVGGVKIDVSHVKITQEN